MEEAVLVLQSKVCWTRSATGGIRLLGRLWFVWEECQARVCTFAVSGLILLHLLHVV